MPYKPENFKPELTKRIKKQQEQTRQKEMAKRYDSEWRALRKKFLMTYPFCWDCQKEGIYKEAEHVHHQVRIEERPDLRLEWSNLEPICRRHHSKRHAEEGLLSESRKKNID